jgi:hypothetical protein
MSLLGKLLLRTKPTIPSSSTNVLCVHVTLMPKWESVADMGQEEKASGYTCDACGQSFTPAEGRALRETEAERLRLLAAAPDAKR